MDIFSNANNNGHGIISKYYNNKSDKAFQVFAFPRLRDESSPVDCILNPNFQPITMQDADGRDCKPYLRVWRSKQGCDRPFFVLDLSSVNILVNISHFSLTSDNPLNNEFRLNSFNFDGRNKGMNHWKVLFIERIIGDNTLPQFANREFHISDENRIKSYFNQFRIILNVNDNDNQLHVRALEIFGDEVTNEKHMKTAKHNFVIHPPLKYIPVQSQSQNKSKSQIELDEKYAQNFSRYLFSDYGGVLHWLSYDCGYDWKPKNPMERGLCTVSTSSALECGSNVNGIVSGSPNNNRCITEDIENSWIMIDFSSASIKVNITHYALKHYRTWDGYALHNWRFEAFNDKKNDWLLLMEHENDRHLNGRGCAHLWTIDNDAVIEIFVNKVRIIQNGVNSADNNRLALGALEIFGTVVFMENINIPNISENDECNEVVTSIFIHRLGSYLQMFANGMENGSQAWMSMDLVQMMNDYETLFNRKLVQSTEEIFHEINDKYFDGKGCDLKECQSILRNTRNRMKEETEEGNMNEIEDNHKLCMIRILDAIHCSVMHAYDTGMKLSNKEREFINIQSSINNNNNNISEEIEDEEVLFTDNESLQRKEILNSRNVLYSNMRMDYDSNINKFMTVVNVENELKTDQNTEKKEVISYSFGYPFKYEMYDDNEEKNDFYIPPKYENMREEIILNQFCSLPIIEFHNTYDRAVKWMLTKYIKEMLGLGNKNIMINIQHILAVMFYCNFTQLSTFFSSTYRRISETLESMITRHSTVRQWGCLLFEAVNDYGQSLDKSPIEIFYHAISTLMLFNSCYARFWCPTSTTTSFVCNAICFDYVHFVLLSSFSAMSVAVFFAKAGIILELVNNKSKLISFFNCHILSDYGNEDEKLFLFNSNSDPIAFQSIRHVEYKHNYQYFISAISAFEQMFSGLCTSVSVTKRNARIIKKMIDWKLNECKTKYPKYVLQLFEKYCENEEEILINVQSLNERYSEFLCLSFFEKWEKEIIAKNEQKWNHKKRDIKYINVLRLIRLDLITKLFPNCKCIEINHLPLTSEVMENVLQSVSNVHQIKHPLQEIRIAFYDKSSDGYFHNQSSMDYEKCKSEYESQLNKFHWKLEKDNMKNNLNIRLESTDDDILSKYYNNNSKAVEVFAFPRLRGESSPVDCILNPKFQPITMQGADGRDFKPYLRVWRSKQGCDRPLIVLDLSSVNILVNISHFSLTSDNPLNNEFILNSFNFDGRKKGMSHWKMLFNKLIILSLSKVKNKFHISDQNRNNSHFNQFRIILNVNVSYNQMYVRALEIFGDVIGNEYQMRDANHSFIIHPPLETKNQPKNDKNWRQIALDEKYTKNFSRYLFSDYGGILHWLSYDCGQDWKPKNPIQRGLCSVSSSTIAFDSDINALVSGSPINHRCITDDIKNSWITIDFSSAGIKVYVTHYALKHYQTWDTYALRNWRFEAFDDEQKKWLLLMEHENDEYLNKRGCTHLWAIDYRADAEVLVNKVRIIQNGFNSANNNRLALGALEIFGTVVFMENINIPKNTESNSSGMEISENKEYKEENISVSIHRLGSNLQMFAKGMENGTQDWMNMDLVQMMDDYETLFSRNSEQTEEIFNEINDKYFNGKGCDLEVCQSILRNDRNRMKEENEEETKNESENNFNSRNKLCMTRILDVIHYSVMHAFDTGMKLTKKERNHINDHVSIGNNFNKMNAEDIKDEDIPFTDIASLQTKEILKSKKVLYSRTNKFMTVVTMEENKNASMGSKLENAGKTEKKSPVYSFGHPFQYHLFNCYKEELWKKNEFYIPPKYENMKEEIFFCYLPINELNITLDRAVKSMLTKCVKKMVHFQSEMLIHIQHILAVMFYCNYTQLCTFFSSTFRRISKETLENLIARHSTVREWGRLLFEAVNHYGQTLDESSIKIFYHGISIPLLFNSCYTRFLCPTSTTASFVCLQVCFGLAQFVLFRSFSASSVAIYFAKEGIILELMNNKSKNTRFFDCQFLSDYGNEDEKLFLFHSNSDPIPFRSIRHIENEHNYQYFIHAISSFEQVFTNNSQALDSVTRRDANILQKMMNWKLYEYKTKCPEYVVQLFENICANVEKINIDILKLNKKYSVFSCLPFFKKLGEELIAKNIQKCKRKNNEKVVRIRVDLIIKLFPVLNNIEIIHLPLTSEVMENILKSISNVQRINHPLQNIRIEKYGSFMGFKKCKSEYESQLNEFHWELEKYYSFFNCCKK